MKTLVNRFRLAFKLARVAVLLAPVLAKGATNELKMELNSVQRFRVSTTLQGSSTLHKTEQDGRDAFGRIILTPSYLITGNLRLSATGSLIQNLNEEQKTDFGNTKVLLSRKALQLTPDTALVLAAGGRLPTNADDRRDNTFNGALVLEPYIMTNWRVLSHGVTTTYQLLTAKNFHTYDRNNLAAPNTSYSVTQYFAVDTYLMKNIVLTLDGDYTYARSYQGTPKTLYSLGQALTFEQPKWSVSVGHTNGADALKANGRDRNVSVFDRNTSAIFGLLRVVY